MSIGLVIIIVMISGRISFSGDRCVIVTGSEGCRGRRGSSSRGGWKMAGLKGSLSAGLRRVSAEDGVVMLVDRCHVISEAPRNPGASRRQKQKSPLF